MVESLGKYLVLDPIPAFFSGVHGPLLAKQTEAYSQPVAP